MCRGNVNVSPYTDKRYPKHAPSPALTQHAALKSSSATTSAVLRLIFIAIPAFPLDRIVFYAPRPAAVLVHTRNTLRDPPRLLAIFRCWSSPPPRLERVFSQQLASCIWIMSRQ